MQYIILNYIILYIVLILYYIILNMILAFIMYYNLFYNVYQAYLHSNVKVTFPCGLPVVLTMVGCGRVFN